MDYTYTGEMISP